MRSKTHPTLKKLAQHIRDVLGDKKCYLVFAHNGTGKTRLSSVFKDLGKKKNKETGEISADTLYYNAFTEDLFNWYNDLEGDVERSLIFNKDSRFFIGLDGFDIESRIRSLLSIYADFEFSIDFNKGQIAFSRQVQTQKGNEIINSIEENIKISRGEESIFIWCFFLAVAGLAIDKEVSYEWVKYIYIDDPISSLDDNNVIAVACHLAKLIRSSDMKVVISTHHTLFFNVMFNEFKSDGIEKRYLDKSSETGKYMTRNTGDTPFFHHVALLKQLKDAADTGKLYTYHFNVLRNIMEKTATFHGFNNFSACIKQDESDLDGTIHLRMTNLLSHGGYSIFEPLEMVADNKQIFKNILDGFLELYKFNDELFIKG